MKPWRIEWNNDTGPNDGGYWEWWTVTNDERTFKCDTQADAEWLLKVLKISYLLEARVRDAEDAAKWRAIAALWHFPGARLEDVIARIVAERSVICMRGPLGMQCTLPADHAGQCSSYFKLG